VWPALAVFGHRYAHPPLQFGDPPLADDHWYIICSKESVMVQRFYRNELKCVGSIPHKSKVIPIIDNWIRPTPRDSGLRRIRQGGVPFSYEERKKKTIQ
jgi:hypothetical protein